MTRCVIEVKGKSKKIPGPSDFRQFCLPLLLQDPGILPVQRLEQGQEFHHLENRSLRHHVALGEGDQEIDLSQPEPVRDVVAGYPVKNIYSETGRKEIAAKIRAFLRENLSERGIEIVDVLLRDIRLPERFRESIELKLTAEQRVQQKEFELEQARKDAEIEVARAKGAARAQEIVRSTLSGSYLQYLWIKTLNENPNVIYVATEANLPIFRAVD